jgi:hypothetical protein
VKSPQTENDGQSNPQDDQNQASERSGISI